MQERYGFNRSRAGTRILASLVIVAFVAALAYVGWAITRPRAEGRLITWSTVSSDRADLTFDVNVPDATCVVRAQDQSHVDVGYATITGINGRVDYRLRTLAPAYVVEVLGCSLPGGTPNAIPPQFPPGVVPPSQPWTPLPASADPPG
jgi:hypothetical protein